MSVKLVPAPKFETWDTTSFDFHKDGAYIHFDITEVSMVTTVAYDLMLGRAVAIKGRAKIEEVSKYVRDYMSGRNYR